MSTLSSWSYTDLLTLWSVTVDEFGQPSYTREYTVPGTWNVGGGTQFDASGVQFSPASAYWMAVSRDLRRPERGWKVCAGYHTGEPPEASETVKKVAFSDDSMHGFTSVDLGLWT